MSKLAMKFGGKNEFSNNLTGYREDRSWIISFDDFFDFEKTWILDEIHCRITGCGKSFYK